MSPGALPIRNQDKNSILLLRCFASLLNMQQNEIYDHMTSLVLHVIQSAKSCLALPLWGFIAKKKKNPNIETRK